MKACELIDTPLESCTMTSTWRLFTCRLHPATINEKYPVSYSTHCQMLTWRWRQHRSHAGTHTSQTRGTDTMSKPQNDAGMREAELDKLLERLEGKVRVPITDGLGPVEGSVEPNNTNEFVRWFPTSPVAKDAVAAIHQLRTELASVRETAWNEAIDKTIVVLREAWHRHAPLFHKRIESQEEMVADMLNSTYRLKIFVDPSALKPQEPKL